MEERGPPDTCPRCWTHEESRHRRPFPARRLGRCVQRARKLKTRNPAGQEKDAASPFPLHRNDLLTAHPPLTPSSFILIRTPRTARAPPRKGMLHFCSIPRKPTGGGWGGGGKLRTAIPEQERARGLVTASAPQIT